MSWASAVAAARAGTAQARIMFLGDSLIEGEGVGSRSQRVQDLVLGYLRTRLSISGSGAGDTPPTYNTYLSDSASWRSPATASPGSSGKDFTRTSGQYFQWTFSGTAVTVLFHWWSGISVPTISVDGGAAVTPTTPGATGQAYRHHITGLSAGSHTVRVTGGASGSRVVGIVAYSGDTPTSGLTYLDWAWTAAGSNQFASGGQYGADGVGVGFAPDLIVDEAFGGNDFLNGSATPSQVATRFANRVSMYRGWSSSPTVVGLVSPNWPAGNSASGTINGYTISDFRNAFVSQANSLSVPVINLQTLLGAMTNGELASDSLHVNSTGQAKWADTIATELTNLADSSSVAGSAPAVSTVSGATTRRLVALGTAAAVSVGVGAAVALLATSASSPTVSAASGVVGVQSAVAGTSTAASAATGATSATQSVAGSSPAVSTASGGMAAALVASGSAPTTSTATGVSSALLPASGASAAVSTASASATPPDSTTGTAPATSTATGTVSLIVGVAGAASTTSAVSGDVRVRLAVAGSAPTLSTANGSATPAGGTSGTAAVAAAATGSVGVAQAAGGASAAVSTASGSAAHAGGTSGTAATGSAATGSVGVRAQAAGVAVATSTAALTSAARYSAAGMASATSAVAGAVGDPTAEVLPIAARILRIPREDRTTRIPAATRTIRS